MSQGSKQSYNWCGHTVTVDGCMACLEKSMAHDMAIKGSSTITGRELTQEQVIQMLGNLITSTDKATKDIVNAEKEKELAELQRRVAAEEADLKQTRERIAVLERELGGEVVMPVNQLTCKELISILQEHVGETGENEGAVDVLKRLSAFWKEWHSDKSHAMVDKIEDFCKQVEKNILVITIAREISSKVWPPDVWIPDHNPGQQFGTGEKLAKRLNAALADLDDPKRGVGQPADSASPKR